MRLLAIADPAKYNICLTKSSSFSVGRGMADVKPAFRFVAAMVYIGLTVEKE
jgi:hypothetical protein